MSWSAASLTRRGPYLIGAGAIVVAGVALGVAVSSGHSADHHRVAFGMHRPFLVRPFGAGPYGAGPLAPLAPRLVRPGLAPAGPSFAGPLRGRLGIAALHGRLTTRNPGGGYRTVDVQRGTVTKVGAGSMTVKSADGFTAVYAVSSALGRGVRTGDTVLVEATVSGGKATVARLVDLARQPGVRTK